MLQFVLVRACNDSVSTDAGAEEKELKELSLGILLMAPLPAVPGFQIHLDKDVHSSSCCIVPGGTVHLTDGKSCLSALYEYHTVTMYGTSCMCGHVQKKVVWSEVHLCCVVALSYCSL